MIMGLEKALQDLERQVKEVAEAARQYDETVDRIVLKERLERYRLHRCGLCDWRLCEYRHKS